MRTLLALLSAFFFASSAQAEETTTTLISRLAMKGTAPAQHYLQIYQTRNKWIFPDVLYVDFGKNSYREVLFGGGRIWHSGKSWKLTHEDYLGQASGPAAKSALYFLPWTKADYALTPRISGNAVYFFYVPLNRGGNFHQAIERAKLEYAFSKTLKAGAGYGGSKPNGKAWQHKPMLTFTVSCGPLGDAEFWLQRLPGNRPQAWIRLVKNFK